MKWWSSKEELLNWARRYDERDKDKELERAFGSETYRELSRKKLLRMLQWKFQGLPGRLKLFRPRVENTEEEEITGAFREAVGYADDKARIERLDELPAVGPAMASVILTFYDPSNYGVLDVHAWRELFGSMPKGLFQGSKHLIEFLTEVRAIARQHAMRARDVEKALFQRNYEQSHAKNLE